MGEQNKTAEKWVMVPVEPTEEMCAAWDKSGACDLKPEHFDEYPGDEWVRKNANLDWKAMLAAAPKVEPAQQATFSKKDLNKLLNDFAQACAFGDDVLARMAASKAIHEYLDAAFSALAAQQAPAQPPAKVVCEGLTDEQIEYAADDADCTWLHKTYGISLRAFARAIEAAHGIGKP